MGRITGLTLPYNLGKFCYKNKKLYRRRFGIKFFIGHCLPTHSVEAVNYLHSLEKSKRKLYSHR